MPAQILVSELDIQPNEPYQVSAQQPEKELHSDDDSDGIKRSYDEEAAHQSPHYNADGAPVPYGIAAVEAAQAAGLKGWSKWSLYIG